MAAVLFMTDLYRSMYTHWMLKRLFGTQWKPLLLAKGAAREVLCLPYQRLAKQPKTTKRMLSKKQTTEYTVGVH